MSLPTTACAPCGPANCNTCPPYTGSFIDNPISGQYTVGEVINLHCSEGYNIWDLMCNEYDVGYLPTLLFETQRVGDGRQLMPKSIPGMQRSLSNDGASTKW
jgi:hypothetical protein